MGGGPSPFKLARVAWRMRRRLPTFVSFNVTNRCTQRCPMCQVWRQPSEELSITEIGRIFRDLREAGFCAVEISGGEPLLRTDLAGILDTFDRLGFVYSLNTNGMLLDATALDTLTGRRGLLQVAVSLDTLDAQKYQTLRGSDSLDTVLENLRALGRRRRIPAKINVTMSRINRDEIFDLLSFARENRLGISVFPVVQGAGHSHRSEDDLFAASLQERAEMAAVFRELARRRRAGAPLWEYSGYYDTAAEYVEGRPIGPCDAGRVFFDLRADGRLAPCVDLPAYASLRDQDVATALSEVSGEASRIAGCSTSTPCCYTCTANITETARHPVRFALESARARLALRG